MHEKRYHYKNYRYGLYCWIVFKFAIDTDQRKRRQNASRYKSDPSSGMSIMELT